MNLPKRSSRWFAALFYVGFVAIGGRAQAQPADRAADDAAARALVAQARTQDPARLPDWRARLGAGGAAERAAAAFAIGQLGVAWDPPTAETRAAAETALLAAWTSERDAAVRDRLVEALGKVGGAAALPRLTAALDGPERIRAALALAALAKSGQHVAAATTARLQARLVDGDASMRWAAALALLRLKDPSTRAALHGCLRDADAVVSATCAKALADVGGDEDAAALAALVGAADSRPAAEAARTLVKLAMKCCGDAACTPLAALAATRGPWAPPVMQAVAFEHWQDPRALPMLRQRYEEYARAKTMEPRARALAGCLAALAHDRVQARLRGRVELLRGCGGRHVGERERQVRMAEALAESAEPEAPGGNGASAAGAANAATATAATGTSRSASGSAAADARAAELTRLAASRFPAVRAAAAAGADAATTRRLLGDHEAEVVAAAAERAQTLKLTAAEPELETALTRLDGPDAIEARQAILATAAELGLAAIVPAVQRLLDVEPYGLRLSVAQALTKLTGKPVHARLPALDPADEAAAAVRPAPALANVRSDRGDKPGAPSSAPAIARPERADQTPPNSAPANARPDLADKPAAVSVPAIVRLRTTRGIIRVQLWTADAPRTTANFVTLVRRHFYDGLPFHRVVPDFVSQSGDPRGDGSGGPGYALRCEIGMRRYEEGVIGMALAGRDTGGSQFFFTQSPQPHLDGRYTAFGELLAGSDVVRSLIEGDVIIEARIE